MMRPAGRLLAGDLAAFVGPIRLHRTHGHSVPCLRAFSASSVRAVVPAAQRPKVLNAEGKKLLKDVKKGKSLKLNRLADIPDEIGYLECVIPPTRKGALNMSNVWASPTKWFVLASLYYQLYRMRSTFKDKFRVEFPDHHFDENDLEKLGVVLYKQMNIAFAAGPFDGPRETIKSICGKSFGEKMLQEMDLRKGRAPLQWKIEKELSKPKLITWFFSEIIPGHGESTIIQAIVRLHYLESLTDGKHEPKTQETYTHLALQSRMWIRPPQWKIIGRVQETALERVMETYAEQKALKKAAKARRPPGPIRRVGMAISSVFSSTFGGWRSRV